MSFILPAGCEYYISLQRTQYQLRVMRKAERIFPNSLVNGALLRWIERLRRERVAALYYDDMISEWRSLEGLIKIDAPRVLDIGCGIGGIDVLISKQCGGMADLYLLDKSQMDNIYYGLKDRAAFYNDFSMTKSFLVANGVPSDRMHFVEAGEGKISALGQRFDLIFSLISWGFHYPLSVYLDEALSALAPDGALVLDLRHGSGDRHVLEDRTDIEFRVLGSYDKYDRISINNRVPFSSKSEV